MATTSTKMCEHMTTGMSLVTINVNLFLNLYPFFQAKRLDFVIDLLILSSKLKV